MFCAVKERMRFAAGHSLDWRRCMYVCTGQRGDAPGSVCMLRNSAYSLFLSLPLSVCVCMYVSLNPDKSVRIPFPALCAFCFYCVFIN